MAPVHPFDATLALLDPLTRRLTVEDLTNLPAEGLPITVLALIPQPVALDLTIQDHGTGPRLTQPRPMSITLAGFGLDAEGHFEPHVLSAAPCHCPAHHALGERWNPLALALIWHKALPPLLETISRHQRHNIADAHQQYCPRGIRLFTTAC